MFNRLDENSKQKSSDPRFNLNTKLILAVLASLLLSLTAFFGLRYCAGQILFAHYDQVYEERAIEVRAALFVAQHEQNLSLDDKRGLQKFLDEYSTDTGVALYDETGWYVASTSAERFRELYPGFYLDQMVQQDVYSHQMLKEAPVGTKNGIWIVAIYGYIPKLVSRLSFLTELLLSIAIFFLFFHLFTRRKMNDLLELEREIQRMKSGDLEHPISIPGRDQLSSLAFHLDQLRLTLLDQILTEEEARKANSELITAMSHDLRTPLTVLTGYLQIVNSNKCKTPEQRERYLILAEKKACQIRELSDRLFEYSLVFGTDELLPLERADGEAFLSRLAEERVPELTARGFRPEYVRDKQPPSRHPSRAWSLEINPQAMGRVWDNLFSNILRYGDPQAPLLFAFTFTGDLLTIRIQNGILAQHSVGAESNPSHDCGSAGIGLKSCRRLMEKQQGNFRKETTEDTFAAELCLPLFRD